jgi:hypothetical protein
MDRFLRLAIAIALLILAWWWQSWLALLGAIFTFYEALAGWCVMYQLLGKNSCPVDHNKKS